MCAQCMVVATGAAATVTGTRAWLATRTWAWLTPTRLRRTTAALLVLGLAASATGSG